MATIVMATIEQSGDIIAITLTKDEVDELNQNITAEDVLALEKMEISLDYVLIDLQIEIVVNYYSALGILLNRVGITIDT